MKMLNRLFAGGIVLCVTDCAAYASEWNVVPTLDLAFKHTNFDFSVGQGSGFSDHNFTALAPSVAIGYGSFYALLYYDFTINPSQVSEAGTLSSPVFSSREYSRDEMSLTFGYSIVPWASVFAGLIEGRSDFFAASFDSSNPANAVTALSAFDFTETGYYLGGSLVKTFGDRGSLSFSAAYGNMDGELELRESAGLSTFLSNAPGYSLALIWTGSINTDMSYRVGVKSTSFTFDIDGITVNGAATPLPAGGLFFDENITSFFIGASAYF